MTTKHEVPALDVDDFLQHYGVTGMKWGKRKGSLKERYKSAAADSVQRRMTANKEIAAGRGQTRDFRRVALYRGGGMHTGAGIATGSKKIAARRARTLEDRYKRITKGKMKARDVIDAAAMVGVQDLFVSRRDRRGPGGGGTGKAQAKVNSGAKHAAKVIAGVGMAVAIGTLASQASTGSLVRKI